ncbi:MAG TPA: YdeI/OmpD-associated family protein [Candidatus Paceibacterota bacterium]|nr:YdeI/OmpD-associated family protein [Candidatus Paceibacterota bacterium]
MPDAIPRISVATTAEFRRWLAKHHKHAKTVAVVLHKKHTGKSAPTHNALMREAICFGWIDTTIKSLDEDRYIRYFVRRRDDGGNWSPNTRRYARELIAQGKMAPHGLVIYKRGLKKKVLGHGIPKNPSIPHELEEALAGDAKAEKAFAALPPSTKRTLYRWILMAKREETRTQRVKRIVSMVRKGERKFF